MLRLRTSTSRSPRGPAMLGPKHPEQGVLGPPGPGTWGFNKWVPQQLRVFGKIPKRHGEFGGNPILGLGSMCEIGSYATEAWDFMGFHAQIIPRQRTSLDLFKNLGRTPTFFLGLMGFCPFPDVGCTGMSRHTSLG